MIALLFVACCQGDPAQAGAAFRAAQEALAQERWDDAIGRLQEALRHEPGETERLLYRDASGRHKLAYHPHRVWAEVRLRQSAKETDAARQRQWHREAITHLELSADPEAPALLGKARASLALLEEVPATTPPAEASLVALRTRIETLCDREHCEEALGLLALQRPLLETMPAERERLETLVAERRASAMERYGRLLALGLESAALADPVATPGAVPALLRPALPSRQLIAKPDPRFQWAERFLSIYEAQLGVLRNPSGATAEALSAAADRIERGALDAPSPAAFRAAWSLSLSLRARRLDEGPRLQEAEHACARAEKARSEREEATLPAWSSLRERVSTMKTALAARERLTAELARWTDAAELALDRSPSMADPSALSRVGAALSEIESAPGWAELPPGARAKALFLGALLDAVAALLEGAPIPERGGARLAKARALEADVAVARRGRLSPRIEEWLGR